MIIPAMASRWQAAWQSLDPDAIVALYAPHSTHMSDSVVRHMKRADGTLRGTADIRAFAEATAGRLSSFRADILDAIAEEGPEGGKASIEYWRIVNGDEADRKRVVEIIEWRGNAITACRVFHF